ncbi:RDD family protein [Lentzea alba]|uniref:RDD family protein n=1 Tax=Lentzea alba TaxID=2714351 RepID=UPI0039BFB9E1
MGDLITGEAVVVDLRTAKFATRAVAFALDTLVQLVALLIAIVIVVLSTSDTALRAALLLSMSVLVLIGYPTTIETLTRGRSLGKLAMGLRVVRQDGGAIRFRHALVRALGGFFVDFWALGLGGVIALFVSLFSPQGKRVGDYLAGTLVIRERVSNQSVPPLEMPPMMAAWAASLDLTALPEELVLAARQFLARYTELGHTTQWTLGTAIADDLGAALRSPREQHVHPYPYISAVLAERRRRASGAEQFGQ